MGPLGLLPVYFHFEILFFIIKHRGWTVGAFNDSSELSCRWRQIYQPHRFFQISHWAKDKKDLSLIGSKETILITFLWLVNISNAVLKNWIKHWFVIFTRWNNSLNSCQIQNVTDPDRSEFILLIYHSEDLMKEIPHYEYFWCFSTGSDVDGRFLCSLPLHVPSCVRILRLLRSLHAHEV